MIAITQSWATLARTGRNEAPSATTKVKRIVTSLWAAPDACASAAMCALIRTSIRLKAWRGRRDHGTTNVIPAKAAAEAANARIWEMSEPGISKRADRRDRACEGDRGPRGGGRAARELAFEARSQGVSL